MTDVNNSASANHPACTLTILMPVRNEGVNLRIMLKMLRVLVEVPHEVVVVHDTPHDDSLDVVSELSSCLLYTSPSPRDGLLSRMPSSA